MTTNKVRKRAIRARMNKTGEWYTAARQHLIGEAVAGHPDHEEELAESPITPSPAAIDPGMSDEAIKRGSGRTWAEWLTILDAWGATARTHKEIAAHLVEAHGVDGWYAQSVTVGYERMRGLRQHGQRGDGAFAGSASRTFAVPIARLFAAWVDEAERSRWLQPGTLQLRTRSELKSARFDDLEAGSIVAVSFVDKGPGKSSVQIQCEKLPSKDAADDFRATWKERLADLAGMLAKG